MLSYEVDDVRNKVHRVLAAADHKKGDVVLLTDSRGGFAMGRVIERYVNVYDATNRSTPADWRYGVGQRWITVEVE